MIMSPSVLPECTEIRVPQRADGRILLAGVDEPVVDRFAEVEAESLVRRYLPGERGDFALAKLFPSRQRNENDVQVAGDVENEELVEHFLVRAQHAGIERVG